MGFLSHPLCAWDSCYCTSNCKRETTEALASHSRAIPFTIPMLETEHRPSQFFQDWVDNDKPVVFWICRTLFASIAGIGQGGSGQQHGLTATDVRILLHAGFHDRRPAKLRQKGLLRQIEIKPTGRY